MSANLAPARSGGSLVHQAMDAVIDHIRAHGLRVGDVVPGEAHFAAELGVSRAVMREAFGALSALNRIEVVNGRKPRVAAIDGSVMAAALDHAVATAQVSVPQVWEVRRTLEVRTATLAAQHRTAEEAERLIGIAEAMVRDADDLAIMTAHDIQFHQAIAAASHNELFRQIVAAFGPLMQVAVPTAWRTRVARDQRAVMLDRHRDVALAIVANDPAAAGAAMEAHFDASIGDLLAG
ncbi:MAG TPA: FCD domain-containing protein [Caulobacteraceae bacterium]|jgi:DNA-binding FadR family transcriptional regulator|nr:FCD domain-containing protein [Caulobacteraceae bacterium]